MITSLQPCGHPGLWDVVTPIFLDQERRPDLLMQGGRGWDMDAGLPSQDRGTCSGSDVCGVTQPYMVAWDLNPGPHDSCA